MPQGKQSQITYYAFGCGMSHVTRAAAILRQLKRQGFTNLLVLTNAVSTLPLKQEKLRVLQFNTATDEELSRQARYALQQSRPDVLIVDTFPCGFVGELTDLLPELSCQKILLAQRLHASQRNEHAPVPHYDLALIAEETTTAFGCPTRYCGPVLLRDADELLPRESARALCGVTDDEPLALAIGTGSASWEADFFTQIRKGWHALRPNAHLRLTTLRESLPTASPYIRHFPHFELFAGADIIIGPGSYDLYHEIHASGAQGIFIPQTSPYDDQAERVRHACIANDPKSLGAALSAALRRSREAPRPPACFTNGAGVAADMIAALALQPA